MRAISCHGRVKGAKYNGFSMKIRLRPSAQPASGETRRPKGLQPEKICTNMMHDREGPPRFSAIGATDTLRKPCKTRC